MLSFPTLLLIIDAMQSCFGYRAAVIEHESIFPTTPIHSTSDALTWMNRNLAVLIPRIQSAADQGADIVLLPEMAITSLTKNRGEMYYFLEQVPSPNSGANSTACGNSAFNDRPILQTLSCLAANNSIFLAVNYGDIVPCNISTDANCPSDHHYQYNTEIVFDPHGEIVAKYWKIHTFQATEFNVPSVEQYSYFTLTDGTSIGIITCFDSMYASPLLPLIKQENINNFIVSHWWNNQYAMFSAAAWWQAVSKRMQINLLAAATWWTQTTEYTWSSGSGIYSEGEILSSWYNQKRDPIEKVLIADVVNSNGPASDLPDFTGYKNISQPAAMCVQKQEWSASSLVAGQDYNGQVVCHDVYASRPFVCSVSFRIQQLDTEMKEYWFLYTDTGYYYQSDGNDVYYYEQFCSFYKCYLTSGCLTSSEQMKDDTGNTVFDYVNVTATFIDAESVQFVLASNGTGNVYAEMNEKIEIESDSEGTTSAKTVDNFDDVLINLSILGRKYSMDGKVV